MSTLIIDIGKSGTRMRLDDGSLARGPGISPEIPGQADGPQRVVEVVRSVFAQFQPRPDPQLVVVGSTAVPEDEVGLGLALQTIWPHSLLGLCEDGVLAHAAAVGGLGVVASIGTGVIVMGLDGSGQLHRVDGWGPDLGDRGSAYELGRRGLAAAFEARDEVGQPTALHDLAREWLGGITLQSAVRLLAAPRRVETIAGFAAQVCTAAEQDDAVAAQLVTEAAIKVAQSCAAAAQKCHQRTVAIRGGLSQSRAYVQALDLALSRFELTCEPARHEVLEAPADLFFTDPYQRLLSYQSPTSRP